MVQIITSAGLKSARRQGTYETQIPFILNGKRYEVPKKIVNGEMELRDFEKPFGETMTFGSLSDLKGLVEKVVLDVELGREKVPLLYGAIYDNITDPNLPQLLEAKWAVRGAVIFLEHLEGQEVKFGVMQAEQGPTVKIRTWAAGFEYTKEMKEFNQTFEIESLNQALGEGHNALLNHLHLSPFLTHTYPAVNKTASLAAAGEERWVSIWRTLNKAASDAATRKRPTSVLLANSSDRSDIEMALKGFQASGTTYPPIPGIESIIFYDGYEVRIGKKDYGYAGVTPGKAYLIRPKRGFKELVKKDLQIESNQGDLSRLVESQMVGFAFRGAFAAVDENVQEVTF